MQSAAEEEARLASMSADERKKYKQKQRKVCSDHHTCTSLSSANLCTVLPSCAMRKSPHEGVAGIIEALHVPGH